MGCLPSKPESTHLLKSKLLASHKSAAKKLCTKVDQAHLLQFENTLTEDEKTELYTQIQSLDLEYCVDVHKRSTAQDLQEGAEITPFPHVDSLASASKSTVESWRTAGLQAVANGQVAFVLLAGGQGTRLGSNDPKGMYNIGLPSNKSLFQLQAEKILRLQTIARKAFPGKAGTVSWFLMTSPATHEATEEFFRAHGNFGLQDDQVVMFQQATFPCFDLNGKIMLNSKHSVNVAPDGNGGIYRALYKSGVLRKMAKKSIEHIYVCSVDNVLSKVCDPEFVGYCIAKKADCGVKVLPKAYPDEKVGVVCLRNKKPAVVEYSEMSPEQNARVDPATGQLMFNTGNVCIHYFSRKFLERAHMIQLPYHVAIKKIPYVDSKGEIVNPSDNSGVKMEQFIFDVFPFAENMAVLEGIREEDFAPVKNAPGNPRDSPDTARQMVSDLHKKWASEAGATFQSNGLFEISPLVSYGGEGLEGKLKNQTISLPHHVSE
eukprot:c4078_g1_i1.p1 GENE.c4078_g1_i1~~c4078_g1_i1.p1  ORF type:complete len:488 (-),score=113.31 c4078_g1_i1:31-1494(-)